MLANHATRIFRVYGAAGHRQKISFEKSFTWDFSGENGPRIISVMCSDKTATNDYVELHITRRTASECLDEIRGQDSDGLFENCRTGRITEIVHGKEIDINLYP